MYIAYEVYKQYISFTTDTKMVPCKEQVVSVDWRGSCSEKEDTPINTLKEEFRSLGH
jgi:hypothetical protein